MSSTTESNPKKQEFIDSVMGRMVCITLKDDRKIYGQLICTDKQKNVVLNDTVTEIDVKYNTPVNKDLKVYLRNEIQASKYLDLPEEITSDEAKLSQINNLFRANKFFSGNVIIAEKNITSISLTQPNKQKTPATVQESKQAN